MKSLHLAGINETAGKIIEAFAAGIEKLDPGFIKGMYITGSIPLQDFHPDKSDIDFLILCRELQDEKRRSLLYQNHKALQKRYGKPQLNGCYLALQQLQSSEPQVSTVLDFHEGRLRYGNFGMAPVTLYELKTVAYTVYGMPASELPNSIGVKDLQAFLFKNINTYWRSWIKRHSLPVYRPHISWTVL